MRALLQDDPPVHDCDAVGMADGGQAMGDDEACAPNLGGGKVEEMRP